MDKIDELLTRGVANIIPNKKALQEYLQTGKKLNIYLGIDPTSTKIHVGHAVALRKLQAFADLGHHVTFLIGDFTALIGDTSDKDSERPVLTKEEIHSNFQTYKKQAEKVLDFSKVTVRNNSEWLSKLTFEDIVKLCQHFSVGDFISRELIRRRLDSGSRVALHEVLYPVMQGYDSYFMDTDLQLGGTDQTFNMQAGRTLQKDLRRKESFVMSNVFLEGTDGRKMSKSWGNAIWLDDAPHSMYGKVMSIKDDLIIPYFTLATGLSIENIDEIKKRLEKGENPMEIKKELAFTLVSELHSESDAKNAENEFQKVVQNQELPSVVPLLEISGHQTVLDVVMNSSLISSKSEAKRLIDQGGVKIDGHTAILNSEIKDGSIMQIGKRGFRKVTIKN